MNESKKIKSVMDSVGLIKEETTLAGVEAKTVAKEVISLLKPIIESSERLRKLQVELATDMYGDNTNTVSILKSIQSELLSISNENPYLRIGKYI